MEIMSVNMPTPMGVEPFQGSDLIEFESPLILSEVIQIQAFQA